LKKPTMKYYEEAQMKDVRSTLEEAILAWPHVSTKKMFGCPSYSVKGRLFAFLVTKGVVLTRLHGEREGLRRE